jgi:hypothetical protein
MKIQTDTPIKSYHKKRQKRSIDVDLDIRFCLVAQTGLKDSPPCQYGFELPSINHYDIGLYNSI